VGGGYCGGCGGRGGSGGVWSESRVLDARCLTRRIALSDETAITPRTVTRLSVEILVKHLAAYES